MDRLETISFLKSLVDLDSYTPFLQRTIPLAIEILESKAARIYLGGEGYVHCDDASTEVTILTPTLYEVDGIEFTSLESVIKEL